jgi:hypothetical protein
MRALKVTAVVALLAFGLGLAADLAGTAAAEEKEKNAKAATCRVILGTVKVKETNKDGNAWDINNGKPDLFVRIRNLTNKGVKDFDTNEKEDTFEADFNVATILAQEGDEIQFEVLDKDVAANDTIGKMRVRLTAEVLKKGTHNFTFDQVRSMTVEFRAQK